MWLASIAGIKGNSHRLSYLIITVCVLSGIANIWELGGLLPILTRSVFSTVRVFCGAGGAGFSLTPETAQLSQALGSNPSRT